MPTLPKTLGDAPPEPVPHDPDSPMTGDQADLLRALCEDAGEPFNSALTQKEALLRIEELRQIVNKDENL